MPRAQPQRGAEHEQRLTSCARWRRRSGCAAKTVACHGGWHSAGPVAEERRDGGLVAADGAPERGGEDARRMVVPTPACGLGHDESSGARIPARSSEPPKAVAGLVVWVDIPVLEIG